MIWLRLAALFWLSCAAALIARSGLYPAALTGDEIWFSEAAYQLLTQGHLARAIHPDAVGSATADFLPPLAALAQAGAFKLFGLTAFAVGLPGAATVIVASALIYGAARRYGATAGAAVASALTAFAAQTLLRAGLYIRYEGFVTVFLLLHALLAARPQRAGLLGAAGRGAAVALAGLAYYPTAPFVGLAALALELGRAARCGRPRLGEALGWILGFAAPAAAFAAWVLPEWEIFRRQILENGGANYLPFDLLRRPFDPALWGAARETIPECLGALAFLVAALVRRRAAPLYGLAAAAALAALAAMIFPFQPRLLAPSLCLILIGLALWASVPRRGGLRVAAARLSLALGMIAGPAMAGVIGATAWIQRDGRDIAAVERALAEAMTEPGAAAIDQRGWLALRRAQPERQLLHAMPSWAQPQVRVFQPLSLSTPQGGDGLAYVLLQTDDRDAAIAAIPALAALRAAGRLTEIRRIAPAFTPLPWAKAAPYDLTLFRAEPQTPQPEAAPGAR